MAKLNFLRRNVPGQGLYLTSVQQVRNGIGRAVPWFALSKDAAGERLTALAKLNATGNLLAGAVTRTGIGFVMNPLTIVKARYEVRARGVTSPKWECRAGRRGRAGGRARVLGVGCRVSGVE